MALRNILTDKDPSLYKVCKPVKQINNRLLTLLDDMAETMYQANGCGLAASQVGVLRRVCVIDCGEGLVELINPEIINTEGAAGCFEGCLSFPGQQGYVIRPQKVKVRALNRHGQQVEYTAEDLFARAIMHETDHLDGKVYLDLVTDPPEGYTEEDNAEEA